jgi:hypothetical protein
MADIVTGTVSGQVDMSDMLRSQADIRQEQEVGKGDIVDAVKTAGWANSDRTGTEADRVVAQDTAYFIAGQSQNFSNATALAALKASTDASFLKTQSDIQLAGMQTAAAATLAGATASAAAALEGAKAAAAAALGQAQIGYAITADGNATRALINTLKMEELNRVLSERQAEIIEHRGDSRYYRDGMTNLQANSLSSQINALHSQFQQATQKTVNFGTMGANTNSAANNVA